MRCWLGAVVFTVAGAVAGCSSATHDASDAAQCEGRGCADAAHDVASDGASDSTTEASCATNDDCAPGVCDTTSGRCVAPCAGDSDCGPQARCDASGLCTPRPGCSLDSDCGTGERCNTCDGICEAAPAGSTPCASDTNCGFEQFCDTCVGFCRDRLGLCEPCARDAECGDEGDLCLDFAAGGRFCGQQCGTCPIGFACDGVVGQCLPLSGSCERVAECTAPGDCPAGETCSEARLCVPGCTDNASCASGLVCQAGACVAPCTGPQTCPAGAECVDGVCAVPGGCTTSADCAEPETYCDRASLRCVPGCEIDDDCMNAAQICVAGACAPRGCRGAWSCAFGEVCDADTGACVAATGPYCDPCDGQDINSCGGGNACLTLEEDGAEAGAFCMVACSDDATNRCPQGYGCREVDLGDEGTRSVCVRACNRDPV